MSSLTNEVKAAWENREGPAIVTTVDSAGRPNTIYATCVGLFDDKIVIADNYFDKTRANILDNGIASVLFMTKENKAYQVKGKLAYHKSGDIFDSMKCWNPEQHPGHAAAILDVEEIYSGADKLL